MCILSAEPWRESYRAILELSGAGKEFPPEHLAPIVAEACSMDVGDVVLAFVPAIDCVGSVTTAGEYARSGVRSRQRCQLHLVNMAVRLNPPGTAIEDTVDEFARETGRIHVKGTRTEPSRLPSGTSPERGLALSNTSVDFRHPLDGDTGFAAPVAQTGCTSEDSDRSK